MRDLVVEYLFQMLIMLPGTTESAPMIVLGPNAFPHHPLTSLDRLAMPSFPVSFFYGSNDWMTSTGAEIIVGNIHKQCANDPRMMTSQIHMISDSNHDIHYDNPEELARKII